MVRDVLVDGYTLYVAGTDGTVDAVDDGGLYHRDTRHLSAFDIRIDGDDFASLGQRIHGSNSQTIVSSDVGTAVNTVDGSGASRRATLTLRVHQAVHEPVGMRQEIELTSYASAFDGRLAVTFDVDFADIFEVRGLSTAIDRTIATDEFDERIQYRYGYRDADGRERSKGTTVRFHREPDSLEDGRAAFDVALGVGQSASFDVEIRPTTDREGDAPRRPGGGVEDRDRLLEIPALETGRDQFDRLIRRAALDLESLATETEHGAVPLAGAPWFATVFGRDSIITAYQTLPVAPSLARGTLRYLAAKQGTSVDEASEEAPGKILHEERDGELAHREYIPHAPYYGTIDATPLWIVLLGELWRWTDEDVVVRELSESLEDALSWIESARERHGDDPYLYYDRAPDAGLHHKAWRDTPGSIQHPDGRNATPPIASVEVQGYVFRALLEAAELYSEVLSDPDRSAALRGEAARFADAFETEFWLDDRGFYAVAKDGDGDVVSTPSSNVGHCLWAGIVADERAPAVADTLLSDELFSGWGIRTMGRSTDGYSPASYHLGSVWPHDTSLIALGLAAYGRYDDAERLARALLEAGVQFDDYRIPELFCGFDDDVSPRTYPSSCVPQAWSAGAPFAALRAAFGFDPTPEPAVDHRPAFLADGTLDPVVERWSSPTR